MFDLSYESNVVKIFRIGNFTVSEADWFDAAGVFFLKMSNNPICMLPFFIELMHDFIMLLCYYQQ